MQKEVRHLLKNLVLLSKGNLVLFFPDLLAKFWLISQKDWQNMGFIITNIFSVAKTGIFCWSFLSSNNFKMALFKTLCSKYADNCTERAPLHWYHSTEFAHLPVCPSVRLSVRPSVCLSVYLSVCLSVCMSVCPTIRLSVHLSVCPSVCLSVRPYVRLSVTLNPHLLFSGCMSPFLARLFAAVSSGLKTRDWFLAPNSVNEHNAGHEWQNLTKHVHVVHFVQKVIPSKILLNNWISN